MENDASIAFFFFFFGQKKRNHECDNNKNNGDKICLSDFHSETYI